MCRVPGARDGARPNTQERAENWQGWRRYRQASWRKTCVAPTVLFLGHGVPALAGWANMWRAYGAGAEVGACGSERSRLTKKAQEASRNCGAAARDAVPSCVRVSSRPCLRQAGGVKPPLQSEFRLSGETWR